MNQHSLSLIAAIILTVGFTAASTVASTAPVPQRTRVETDQKTGAVLFIVDGREEARIDRNGVHVRRSVEYGGTLTDIGTGGYDRQAGAALAH